MRNIVSRKKSNSDPNINAKASKSATSEDANGEVGECYFWCLLSSKCWVKARNIGHPLALKMVTKELVFIASIVGPVGSLK